MLVQITFIEKNIAVCIQIRITPCSACFLHIVFQRIGNVIVNHQTDILFVHAHAKGRGRNNDLHLSGDKRLLILDFFAAVHFPVKRSCFVAVICQLLRDLHSALGAGYIDDRRAVLLLDQSAQRIIFFVIICLIQHLIPKIAAGGSSRIQFQIQPQLHLEIVADILNDLLFCGCREAGYRNRIADILLFLKMTDKISDIEIVHAEILSPRREAVCFIYDKPHDIPREQQFLDRAGPQRFRRDVEQRCDAVLYALNRFSTLHSIQQTVDCDCIGNAAFCQIIHLVFHQRLQRRNNYGQTFRIFASHKRRKLESDGFSAAGREYRKQ